MKKLTAINQSIDLLAETYKRLKASSSDLTTLNQEKMSWAHDILNRLNVDLEISGTANPDPSLLFVGNHISYLDIPLLYASVNGMSFVSKHEIKRWPVFGKGAEKLDTVFVKRGNDSSRKDARKSIEDALKQGKRIVIFPSGTTSIDGKKSWRKGAFEIAANTKLWVQPFRLSYMPLRDVAYIDNDFFPHHLYKLFHVKEVTAKIEFHEPIKIDDPIKDCLTWQSWAQQSDK